MFPPLYFNYLTVICEANLHFTQRSGQSTEVFFQESVKLTQKFNYLTVICEVILHFTQRSGQCTEVFFQESVKLT